jgi:restriction endonuclease S subunit
MRHALAPLIQGVTRQRVNLSNLKKLPIPTPSIEKQEELVSILRNAQKAYDIVQAKQLKMNVLLQRLISSY